MKTLNLLTPDQAEAAFYAAFESGDVEAMMAVWSDDSSIICIHPRGPRLVGRAAIREGWQQILQNSPPMRFNVSEINTISSGALAIRFVSESIHISGAAKSKFTVMATNAYRRTTDGWRIVLHHASPAVESPSATVPSERGEGKQDRTIH